jgi:hypothetical protein
MPPGGIPPMVYWGGEEKTDHRIEAAVFEKEGSGA